MKPPPVTLEINTGSCLIQVRGKRSRKGWNILEISGAASTHLGHEKEKDKAIRFAREACEPGVSATFLVKPAD